MTPRHADVISLEASNDKFRLLYDVKGRYKLHPIDDNEGKFKLCRVNKVQFTTKSIPYLVTHDGRTIRYPDPAIKVNDTIKLDIATGKILSFVKFEVGNTCMITKGRNAGRVGVMTHRDRCEAAAAAAACACPPHPASPRLTPTLPTATPGALTSCTSRTAWATPSPPAWPT